MTLFAVPEVEACRLALPSLSCADPTTLPVPSRKFTVPVAALGATEAESATDVPTVRLNGEAEMDVELGVEPGHTGGGPATESEPAPHPVPNKRQKVPIGKAICRAKRLWRELKRVRCTLNLL